MGRPGGLPTYDLWRLNQINAVVGDYTIARAARPGPNSPRRAVAGSRRQQCNDSVQRSAPRSTICRTPKASFRRLPKRPKGERIDKEAHPVPIGGASRSADESYAEHAQPIAVMLRWQGLRIGEALRIGWDQVNWKANSIFIAESKNGEARTVAMHKKVRAALHKLLCAQGSPGEGMVFLTQRGVPYHDPRLYRSFRAGARSRRRTAPPSGGLPSATSTSTTGGTIGPASASWPGSISKRSGKRADGSRCAWWSATAVSAAHRTQAMRKLK